MPYYGYGYGFGMDPAYLLLVVVSLVLGVLTQSYIDRTYKTWSRVSSDGASGAEVARRMLDANGCGRVGIKHVAGHLTDHYDPRDKTTSTCPPITFRAGRWPASRWPVMRRGTRPSASRAFS